MRVEIVAADSMGVRSLATFVEACGYSIGVDLGASIAPRRFSLPPHPRELRRLEQALDMARRRLEESSIAIITHYHYDHYLRDEPELYAGRLLLAKDINRSINRSQRIRGYRFIVKSGLLERGRVEYADSRVLTFEGGLTIEFSKPVWHGEEGTKLGKVLMARIICEGLSVVFASDVQGPGSREALEELLKWSRPRPLVLIISGPPLYLGGYRVGRSSVELGIRNLEVIVEKLRPKNLVVDHHLVRDPGFREVLQSLRGKAAGTGVEVLTAAEYMGLPLEPLETMRRELWKGEEG
ncbi:predicted hydrolase [Aeropyrum camini SY1 = JCM 12091]|uniref:UPF0282 protein ACAM_0387 n=1 Tax=Aeropyrum camini SY1 = JCM 12091 TaxID=1198449 RepID=U3TBQ6_9CREN|nr:predicted hydrolase [Aeropyrum camini SY1 = JCM 12091]